MFDIVPQAKEITLHIIPLESQNRLFRYFERQYGSQILIRYRHNLSADQYKLGRGVTFEEFAKWIVEKRVFNPHWASMTSLCHPCVLNYDFVGKMETFDSDVAYMLKVLGTNFRFPTILKEAYKVSSALLTQTYFAKLSLLLKKRLYQIYKNDFENFGYTIPKEYKSPPRSSEDGVRRDGVRVLPKLLTSMKLPRRT